MFKKFFIYFFVICISLGVAGCGKGLVDTEKVNEAQIIESDTLIELQLGTTDANGELVISLGILDDESNSSSTMGTYAIDPALNRSEIVVRTLPSTKVSIRVQKYNTPNDIMDNYSVSGVMFYNIPTGIYKMILKKDGYVTKVVPNVPVIQGRGAFLIEEVLERSLPASFEMTVDFNNNEWFDTNMDVRAGGYLNWDCDSFGDCFSVEFSANSDFSGSVTGSALIPSRYWEGQYVLPMGLNLEYKIVQENSTGTDYTSVGLFDCSVNQLETPTIYIPLEREMEQDGRLYIRIQPFISTPIDDFGTPSYYRNPTGNYTFTITSIE